MLGPTGSGKTMLAKRVPTILPDLMPSESIETKRIYESNRANRPRTRLSRAASTRPIIPMISLVSAA